MSVWAYCLKPFLAREFSRRGIWFEVIWQFGFGTRRRLVAGRALRINYGQARSYMFCCDAAGHI